MSSSHFSSALQLTDLDDFISPSQSCVKPVKLQRSRSAAAVRIHLDEEDGGYYQLDRDGSGQRRRLEKARISLDDCLACSGCVTSSESVLVAQQSPAELLRVLRDNGSGAADGQKLLVVASLSAQSRASLAAHYGLSSSGDAGRRLATFLRSLGVHQVLDADLGRTLSLLESQKEFVRRFQEQKEGSRGAFLPMLTSSCPGWVCYAEKTQGGSALPYLSSARSPQQVMGALVKSVLTARRGLNPGDVYHVAVMPCYDKKLEASRTQFQMEEEDSGGSGGTTRTRQVDCVLTSGEVLKLLEENGTSLLDLEPTPLDEMFVDGVEGSPRGAGGRLGGGEDEGLEGSSGSRGKDMGSSGHAGRSLGGGEEMEGSPSFTRGSPGSRGEEKGSTGHVGRGLGGREDVEDSGSSSEHCGEKKGSLGNTGRSLGGVEEVEGSGSDPEHCGVDKAPSGRATGSREEARYSCHAGGASGGYLHHVFTHAARRLFGVEVSHLSYRTTRNRDFREVVLERDGEVLLRFAAAYGLRNVQKVLLGLRRGGASPYHFLEVMACPSGCANGGGQVKPPAAAAAVDRSSRELRVQEVERLYLAERPLVAPEEEEERAAEIYRSWMDNVGEEKARVLLHTTYHAVERNTTLSVAW